MRTTLPHAPAPLVHPVSNRNQSRWIGRVASKQLMSDGPRQLLDIVAQAISIGHSLASLADTDALELPLSQRSPGESLARWGPPCASSRPDRWLSVTFISKSRLASSDKRPSPSSAEGSVPAAARLDLVGTMGLLLSRGSVRRISRLLRPPWMAGCRERADPCFLAAAVVSSAWAERAPCPPIASLAPNRGMF